MTKLSQIFKEIEEIEPDPKLEGLILSQIEALTEKQAQKKLAWSYFGLAGSLTAFTLAIVGYGQIFLNSDFWILLKLLITDAGLVLENGNDFIFSLLETFPAVSAVIILIPIFTLLISLSVYFKSIRKNHWNHYNYV